MISRAPVLEPESPRPGDRWRQSWLVVFAAAIVLLIVVLVGQQLTAPVPAGNPAAASSPSAASPSTPSADPTPSAAAPGGPMPGASLPGGSPVPGGPVPGVSLPGGAAAPGGSVPGASLPGGAAGNAPASGGPLLESGPASASPSPSAVAAGPFPAPGVLRLSGAAPTRGTGRFEYSAARGPVAGAKGPLRRYRVAVERGSNEDVEAFSAQVRAILGDRRSWAGSGRVRLQPVAGSEPADFTVYLATRETAGQMCLRGGTNIRIGGVPFTSCRATGKAIINLDRWRGSAKPYLQAKVDLATYRKYVINHEVGHELGHRHEGCPKAGGPAPVMVQQTITLRGCVPYAWPRRNNRDFSGPRL
ncbi:DUF3152 domain-containing protein [Actinoplanes sp. NPDC024001]|uniref:DUF3152 domain-containing protein n=1 Tax=Actinoplanes sp. NPDC024001 TaxID=3154598 RepID=UPI0033D04924